MKLSLEEAVKLEDYDEVGYISLFSFKEALDMLDVEIEESLRDFIFYYVYTKSESAEKLKY